MSIFPDFSTLTAGAIIPGVITMLFDDGTARTVSILSVVAPSPSNAPNFAELRANGEIAPRIASCPSSNLQIQSRSLQANFGAVVGRATTVEAQIADDCGNLIGPTGAAVQATFTSGDPAVNLTHTTNGIWTGTWRPVRGNAGAVSMTLTAFQFQASGAQKQGQKVLSGSLNTGTAPIVTASGVVHGASFASGVPIAPGSLITIYGSNLANSGGSAGGLPLPQQLNGVQVRLGNELLPLLFTSAGQMNVQVPFDIPVNTQSQMTVQKDNVLSVPESIVVAPAQPGIFTLNQQGTGQGVILKSDQVTLAQPDTPAAVGETIVIYCTGLGPVTPTVAAGAPAPSSPLSSTANPVTVVIDGQPAQAGFAGLTPGFPGLYQVNVVVPPGVSAGNAVSVVLQVAGQSSPPVTMAIR